MEYVSLEKSRSGWQPDQPDAPPPGKALTAALKAAGLPTTGNVAEKQARLAAHEADSDAAPPPQTPADPAANDTHPDDGASVSNPEED